MSHSSLWQNLLKLKSRAFKHFPIGHRLVFFFHNKQVSQMLGHRTDTDCRTFHLKILTWDPVMHPGVYIKRTLDVPLLVDDPGRHAPGFSVLPVDTSPWFTAVTLFPSSCFQNCLPNKLLHPSPYLRLCLGETSED